MSDEPCLLYRVSAIRPSWDPTSYHQPNRHHRQSNYYCPATTPDPERLPPKAVTSSPAERPVPILLHPFSTLIASRTTTIVTRDKSSQILCFSPLQGLPPKVV
ncbi:uncharacterized protein PGTG_01072 [Puccinia graminis f. sp. tritici CRL 75-36-700-3]|uniref:Uncharacterized protein n=1 Tax=Puccinia graminis f. sp. tritici (strain CRL 75-36-700-3 / race SCCL) TaxID=418459 RepID=E3JUL6_PUCGT|nr:uncharacterized protein PGTG_01072 [Puccinia graminis f. sp. tritici CRL 75-36-700-3]EFP75741.2 hypothetical protein PGTG_01072 [Puccinia graminis f. sp. tritici CRL 75-36-700-3]